jgi:RHS repeat-associated protein
MTASSYNNGVSESRTYNTDNTLTSINFTGAPIGNLAYGWDANKNKTSEGISGQITNCPMNGYGFNVARSGYDSEDRLFNWQRSDNNLTQAWNLCSVGDWNSITENASTQSRTHGPTHELLNVAGQAVQHDVKGNMTLIPANLRSTTSSTPQPLTLTRDFDNRLASVDTNNDSTADVLYKRNALGRRVYRDDGTTATVYVQSDQQTIADYTAGTAPTSPTYTYVYASYIDEPVMRSGSGNLVYLHRNQQYSVISLTNASGTITERYVYSAYGTPTITDASGTVRATSAIRNRYLYTGREWDEKLPLYHYRARMYDSAAGRFCSRDPIGFDGSVWNTYGNVSNNSGSRLDPSGKSFFGANGIEQADSGWWTWYFIGNGEYLNLNTTSPTLWNAWANSPITQGFVNEMKGYITPPNLLDGDCDTTNSGFVSFSSKVDYAPGNGLWQAATDTLFAIGNSTLEGLISCTTTATCTEHVYEEVSNCADSGRFVIRDRCQSKQCSGIATLSDAFVDARDRHDKTPGNQKFPGGVGYSFGATFSFSMNFPETCSETKDFDYSYWD